MDWTVPIEAPPDQNDGPSDDDWDVVKTIQELESLEVHIHRVIQHTANRMGISHGYAPDGTEMIEHPLGKCMAVIQQTLKICHAKYGRDMLAEARFMDGSIDVLKEEP